MQRFFGFTRLINRELLKQFPANIVPAAQSLQALKKGVAIMMKRVVYRYKISKFKRCMNGMMFALICGIALILCMTDLSHGSATQYEVILPFFIAIVSLLLGLFTMLHDNGRTKEKIQ